MKLQEKNGVSSQSAIFPFTRVTYTCMCHLSLKIYPFCGNITRTTCQTCVLASRRLCGHVCNFRQRRVNQGTNSTANIPTFLAVFSRKFTKRIRGNAPRCNSAIRILVTLFSFFVFSWAPMAVTDAAFFKYWFDPTLTQYKVKGARARQVLRGINPISARLHSAWNWLLFE